MCHDGALVARVLDGDRSAYGILIGRHQRWLYRFIRRHLVNAEDANDVLQETFASAWAALARYDRDRPFEIWLRRIALNKCRDLGRKQTVRRAVFALTHPFAEVEARSPSEAPSADAGMIANEALARLQAAISALPSHLRDPLVLTALEGLSQKDAAAVLKTNVKAIENRVSRAKAKLAATLDVTQVRDISDLDG